MKKKKKELSRKNVTLSLKEIWPQERDIFIRPERMRYVRRLIKEESCVFCAAAEKKPQFKTLCVFQTKYSMLVLNKYPYNNGHILVIPKKHIGDIWGLTNAEYKDLTLLLRKAIKVLYDVYDCDGVNMGLNHGAVAGAGIPEHLHFHVIPRWRGDVNFFPLIAECKVLVESLEDSYKKLRRALLKEVRNA
jgi:ATP adenylyltransferase